MDTIFVNSKKSGTSDPHGLKEKWYLALSNLSNYNKFHKAAPTWYEKFELPDESYSVSEIQSCFEYIFKNIEERLIILQWKYM